MDPVFLGIALVAIGVVVFLVVRLVLWLSSKTHSQDLTNQLVIGDNSSSEGQNAILMIRTGGKIISINSKAREILQLKETESANLERISRAIRPGEIFLHLCASGGRAKLFLGDKVFDAASFKLNIHPLPLVIMTLEESKAESDDTSLQEGLSPQFLKAVECVVQIIAERVDLDQALRIIIESVEKILPADMVELTIWDPNISCLVPYRLSGYPGNMDRTIDVSEDYYLKGEGYSGYLIKERKALFFTDTSTDSLAEELLADSEHKA
ncbi:MAG: hypothetical protein MUO76_10735, partial [Anaerolineaceae bacterium]|nr:hypothetical protein [Anaerolineaceae bacterium]